MDPAQAYEFSGWLGIHSSYDTLVKFEGKDLTVLKPGLATEWDVKDAGDGANGAAAKGVQMSFLWFEKLAKVRAPAPVTTCPAGEC